MSNFVAHYHKAHILKVFKAFSNGLPNYYEEFSGDTANAAVCQSVIDSFFQTCKIYHSEIMDAVAAEIYRYMNYYGVEAKDGVDEYKLIYFMGMRLAAFLERDRHVLASKVIHYATVIMLDERLKSYTHGKGRPELKDRLKTLIEDGILEAKLGTDGMYLIYKCSSNMLKES